MQTRQWPWIQSSLPFMGMVSVIVALATSTIISKTAMSNGVSFYILSVYSNGVATLILFPTAFILHRSKRPPLSFPVLFRIFLLAAFGCSADIIGNAGLNYGSPTLTSAMANLVPAFTYILAIIFSKTLERSRENVTVYAIARLIISSAAFVVGQYLVAAGAKAVLLPILWMEEVHLRKLSTISKLLGTLVSISGAFIVTFYKGPAIIHTTLTSGSSKLLYLQQTQNWVLGGLFTASACLLTASWCILQALILKMYPAEMIAVAIYCFFVTIQASVVSLIAERDLTAWRIETKIGLIAVLYLAIINIAYRLYVTAWCLWRTGPLFVSLFKPLMIVITVAIGVIFMKDDLYLGSLVGALVLVIGFYGVMWGKAKEGGLYKGTESSDFEAPLLQENAQV